MYKGKFDSKYRQQHVTEKETLAQASGTADAPEKTPAPVNEAVPVDNSVPVENVAPVAEAAPVQEVIPEEPAVAQAPSGKAKKKQEKAPKAKKVKKKGNRAITAIFYTFYFLLIISSVVGMIFVREFLIDWLKDFESAQPTVKSEEVFQELFANPDWAAIYDEAGLTDTEFEGKDAFVTYMESVTGEGGLTYAETSAGLSGDHKYLIKLGDKKLGYFTLSDHNAEDAPIPDWQLNEVSIDLSRNESVTVQMLEGNTVYINGKPVSDDYTIQITSSVAEEYLPEGTTGIRLLKQEITGLLVPPQVQILDTEGNEVTVNYDEETGIYSQQLPEAAAITKELEQRVIEAAEAYSLFMVNRQTARFPNYFATGTQTYKNIIGMDRWQQTSKSAAFTEAVVSEYVRYSDDLFSARVVLTLNLTRTNDTIKEYPLDTTLFFENRRAGWMVISMTNVDVQEETSQVRLTFKDGDTLLSSEFYGSDVSEIDSPPITVPEGMVFSGWAKKEIANDGTITMTQIFSVDETGLIKVPGGTTLEPMTLYPLFEDASSVADTGYVPDTTNTTEAADTSAPSETGEE